MTANRRNAISGPVVRDQVTSGPYNGTRIIFLESELDKIVVQANPPSGTTQLRRSGSPIFEFWEAEINATGSFFYAGEITDRSRKTFTLILWLEFYCWPQVVKAVDQMVTDGWSDPRKRAATKSVLVSWGIPEANATLIANGFINNTTKPTFGDLGLGHIPRWARRMSLSSLVPDVEET